MNARNARHIERARLIVAAQRRRLDLMRWQETFNRVAHIKPRDDVEATAKVECLHLLEQARPGWR